jgi:hypothetical protein
VSPLPERREIRTVLWLIHAESLAINISMHDASCWEGQQEFPLILLHGASQVKTPCCGILHIIGRLGVGLVDGGR